MKKRYHFEKTDYMHTLAVSKYFFQNKQYLFSISGILGQISAVMSVVEALVPVLANPAYNQVYQYTLDSEFPGTVFLVTAGCMVICIIAFM